MKARTTGISLVTSMGFSENKWRGEVRICNYWPLLTKLGCEPLKKPKIFFFKQTEWKELWGKLWSDNDECGQIQITNDDLWVKKLWITDVMSWLACCWSPTQTPTYGMKDWQCVYITTPEDNNSSSQTPRRTAAPSEGTQVQPHSLTKPKWQKHPNFSANLLN